MAQGTLVDPIVFTAICGVLGLLVGSFLNVVIHRLPKMMERDWLAQCAELRGEDQPAPNAGIKSLHLRISPY